MAICIIYRNGVGHKCRQHYFRLSFLVAYVSNLDVYLGLFELFVIMGYYVNNIPIFLFSKIYSFSLAHPPRINVQNLYHNF
jgi:hypothetical protein